MNNNTFIGMIVCLPMFLLGWSNNGSGLGKWTQSTQESVSNKAAPTVQISGVGFYAEPADNCNASEGEGASYVVHLTGDLEGCLYAFIEEFGCQESGTYKELGREVFVGMYRGQSGTFETTYQFSAKFEGCNPDGTPMGAEIVGRCEHPIVKGSGTGVFEGATGRLDFKDDVVNIKFPYRGHIKL